ncbi:MAG: hypothetical protein ACXAEU_23720 [Candidatus Hodarchaeales archaeon]|jgi:hypothetical protein
MTNINYKVRSNKNQPNAQISSGQESKPVTAKIDYYVDFYTKLTALCIIKQSRLGPVAYGDIIPSVGLDIDDLNSLSCYYSLAVGQGNHYKEGLYGPLPVLGTEFRSLLYAVTVIDENQEDQRMGNKHYLVMCFFYHKQLEEAVNKSRMGLTRTFDKFFINNASIEQVENNWEVLKMLIQNHIYCSDILLKNGESDA